MPYVDAETLAQQAIANFFSNINQIVEFLLGTRSLEYSPHKSSRVERL
jgi:hypothetical protein